MNGFILELENISNLILENPEIGSDRFSYLLQDRKLKHFIIKDYKYFMFYSIETDHIRLQRVLHTSRDIKSALFI